MRPNQALVTALGLITLAALASGCGPRDIRLRIMQPSLVMLPPDVQTIAIIDRSKPKNKKQTTRRVVEGVLTGEAVNADKEGRVRAINGVATILRDSSRYEVILPATNKREFQAARSGKEWSHSGVAKLCEEHGCDAVLALDAFDSDWVIRLTGPVIPTSGGINLQRALLNFSVRTRVATTWRVYDARVDRVLDVIRDYERTSTSTMTGRSLIDVRSRLPGQSNVVNNISTQAGAAYGRRITPTWTWVGRNYYGRGDKQMKRAKNHVLAGDWEGVVPIWQEVARANEGKRKGGKALMNLALAAEVNGELTKAEALATRAAIDLPKDLPRRYARILRARLQQQHPSPSPGSATAG